MKRKDKEIKIINKDNEFLIPKSIREIETWCVYYYKKNPIVYDFVNLICLKKKPNQKDIVAILMPFLRNLTFIEIKQQKKRKQKR